jgi:hypothetical protein
MSDTTLGAPGPWGQWTAEQIELAAIVRMRQSETIPQDTTPRTYWLCMSPERRAEYRALAKEVLAVANAT